MADYSAKLSINLILRMALHLKYVLTEIFGIGKIYRNAQLYLPFILQVQSPSG
jgi:hypothetical protein